MTKGDLKDLIRVFESMYKYYKGWVFAYEHPGFFVYHQMGGPLDVAFTPDHDELGSVSIQVITADAEVKESQSVRYVYPQNATGEMFAPWLFAAVRPYLEKYDTW